MFFSPLQGKILQDMIMLMKYTRILAKTINKRARKSQLEFVKDLVISQEQLFLLITKKGRFKSWFKSAENRTMNQFIWILIFPKGDMIEVNILQLILNYIKYPVPKEQSMKAASSGCVEGWGGGCSFYLFISIDIN